MASLLETLVIDGIRNRVAEQIAILKEAKYNKREKIAELESLDEQQKAGVTELKIEAFAIEWRVLMLKADIDELSQIESALSEQETWLKALINEG